MPWRWYRLLAADAFVIRKIQTINIFGQTMSKKHVLAPWDKVEENA